MTCIVGFRHAQGIIVGGDSAGSDGYVIQRNVRPKVFKNGEFLIGYTTSFRMGQVLEFDLHPPVVPPGEDPLTSMVARFIPEVRKALKESGFAEVENNQETGGVFLVAFRGRLFAVQRDFSVLEAMDGYDACGSGEEYALGALHSVMPPGYFPGTASSQTARAAVVRALEAAAHFNPGVRGPFTILDDGPSTEGR